MRATDTENVHFNPTDFLIPEQLTKESIMEHFVLDEVLHNEEKFKDIKIVIGIIANLLQLEEAGKEVLEYMANKAIYSSEQFKQLVDQAKDYLSRNYFITTYHYFEMCGCSIDRKKCSKEAPYLEIKEELRITKKEKMGLAYDSKLKREKLQVDTFVKYFFSRVHLVSLQGSCYLAYHAGGVYKMLKDDEVAKIAYHTLKEVGFTGWSINYRREILEAIGNQVLEIKDTDPNKDLINVRNGMLDINDFSLVEHHPKHYSTKRFPIIYDPEAACPVFESFLHDITLGDEELKVVFQEMLGYILVNRTYGEKSYFFYGTGSNGKSVMSQVIKAMVGEENVSHVSINKFNDKFELKPIIGKVVNIANENELDGKKMSTEALKSIASGDSLSICIKHKDAITITPTLKLIFLVNELPSTFDKTDGYYRKICIIPFRKKVLPEEQDKYLVDKLKAELDGIFRFAIDGLKRLQSNEYKFTKAKVCEDILNDYITKQNPIIEFIQDCLQLDYSAEINKKNVREGFRKWAENQGRYDLVAMSDKKFWDLFKKAVARKNQPFEERKSNSNRFLKYYKLQEVS